MLLSMKLIFNIYTNCILVTFQLKWVCGCSLILGMHRQKFYFCNLLHNWAHFLRWKIMRFSEWAAQNTCGTRFGVDFRSSSLVVFKMLSHLLFVFATCTALLAVNGLSSTPSGAEDCNDVSYYDDIKYKTEDCNLCTTDFEQVRNIKKQLLECKPLK